MLRLPPHFLSILMLGLASQVVQIVMLRELLMLFHGNELSIGVILAAWMAWVGAGSMLGAALAERTDRPLLAMAWIAAALLPVLALSLMMIRGLRGFFDVVPGAYLSLNDIALGSFLGLAPVCLLLGMQFVLLAKLWRQRDRSIDTTGAGNTYIGEAMGSILGGVLFTFVLVHQLNALQTVIVIGMLVALCVIWSGRSQALFSGQIDRGARWLMMVALVLGAGALALSEHLDRWGMALYWQQLAPDHQLLETHQSKYGNIAVAVREDQFSFFRSGHLMFSTAGPDSPPTGLEAQEAAVLAHMAMAHHPAPRRVLLIGGGLRGTLAELVRHPLESIDYVELDPVLTEAARPHLPAHTLAALADPRVRLIHADGRLFVRSTDRRYDLIIVDVPDPTTAVLNRYYTREFFSQAHALLDAQGIFVIGMVSTPGLRGQAIANRNASIFHTLDSVFEQVRAIGDHSLVLIAGDASASVMADIATLRQRHSANDIDSPAFRPGHFDLLLEYSQLNRINWQLRHHGRGPEAHLSAPPPAPFRPPPVAEQLALVDTLEPIASRFFINSDFRPIGYFHTLMVWAELTRGERSLLLPGLLELGAAWIIVPVLVVLLIVLALRLLAAGQGRPRDRSFAVGVAVFTTGLSTMSLQIALLFSFQSLYGFIYEMVGLIVAIFMAGLATGTLLTHRFVRDRANPDILAAVQLTIAVFSVLIGISLPAIAAIPSIHAIFFLFSCLTFISGVLNGFDFPLATESFRALNRRAERSTGQVYSIELLGACLGAALASAVIAPIMGLVACCLLAALANATAFVALMISRRTDGYRSTRPG